LQLPDLINGLFEAFGAWAIWGNVLRLLRDKDVKGIVWQYQAVFWVWGIWNLAYYPLLHQWFSTAAGVVLVLGNGVWLYVWYRIRKERDLLQMRPNYYDDN
jgi:hypothetical protein